jgi:FAD/FMN-containing dehydrogenase
VVRDAATYPTPVTVVGSMHSVNECVVNDGGTLLVTAAMDRVLGLVGGGADRLVKVEAGCKLATLHRWLADRVGGLIGTEPPLPAAMTTASSDHTPLSAREAARPWAPRRAQSCPSAPKSVMRRWAAW